MLEPSGSTKPTRLCARQIAGRRRPRCVALGNSEHRGQGRLCEGKLLPVESGRVDTTFIIEGEHSKGAADNAPRTAIGRFDNQVGHALDGGSIRWLSWRQSAGSRSRRSNGRRRHRTAGAALAHGRIAPGVQAATIQPWPKTFRPSSLTAVFAMRPNRLARRFSAPATRALASSAGSTGSRGSFSRNASLAAQRWSALQPVTPWSDASVRMTAIGRAAQLIHQRTRRRPIGPRL
jgi:hypothetical protein